MNKFSLRQRLAKIPAFAILLAIAFSPVAHGDTMPDSKWYFGFKIPLMFIDATDSNASGTIPTGNTEMPTTTTLKATVDSKYGTGYKLSGLLGYQYSPNVRIEGELFFGSAKVEKATYKVSQPQGLGTVNVGISGKSKQRGIMLSVWYDIASQAKWKPYVGGGIGYVKADTSGLKYNFPQSLDLTPTGTKDSALAYHLGAGLAYKLNDLTTLDIGYRYQTTKTLTLEVKNQAVDVDVDSKLRLQLLEVGIRRKF